MRGFSFANDRRVDGEPVHPKAEVGVVEANGLDYGFTGRLRRPRIDTRRLPLEIAPQPFGKLHLLNCVIPANRQHHPS